MLEKSLQAVALAVMTDLSAILRKVTKGKTFFELYSLNEDLNIYCGF